MKVTSLEKRGLGLFKIYFKKGGQGKESIKRREGEGNGGEMNGRERGRRERGRT